MDLITNAGARRLTIGQLSQTTDVNIETIRYYERIRLLDAPPRTPGGHRSYSDIDVGRLHFVRRARELGFSIDHIRTLLALADEGGALCSNVRSLAAGHLADVRARLADLRKLEEILARTVSECDAQCAERPAPLCPLIEVLQEPDQPGLNVS